MKILITVFVFLFSSNIVFADTGAKLYLKDGDQIIDQTIDATGFMHGIEMNVPGTAYLINVTVENAGTSFVTADGRHGDGRGVVATGAGVHIIVLNSHSKDNSEDGFRVNHGATLTIINSKASGNKKIGYFAGTDGTMIVNGSDGYDNLYGLLGANRFLTMTINGSRFYSNRNEGIQVINGQSVNITTSAITSNNTDKKTNEDYGGVSIFGVKNVTIQNSTITGNYSVGIYSVSDSTEKDFPVRLHIGDTIISGNGKVGIESKGDSVVTVVGSYLDGKCLESPDPGTSGKVGIITIDGKAVVSGDCPGN